MRPEPKSEKQSMKPHDVKVLAGRLSRVQLRRASGDDTAFAGTPFAKLAAFNGGGVFVGRFTGRTPWERHRRGDELVHVLDGEVDLTVMTPRRPVHVTLSTGGLVVVPRGLWHRQHARTTVTLLTATPTPTDHSFAEDPRSRKERRR